MKEDVDNNNIGEVNLVGVTITLLDSSNSVVATTLIDSNGDYLFVDLPVGVYSVSETNLAEYSDVSDVDDTNDINKALSLAPSVSPAPSVSYAPSKACVSILTGSAREDVDNDCDGDTPLPGVLIF